MNLQLKNSMNITYIPSKDELIHSLQHEYHTLARRYQEQLLVRCETDDETYVSHAICKAINAQMLRIRNVIKASVQQEDVKIEEAQK